MLAENLCGTSRFSLSTWISVALSMVLWIGGHTFISVHGVMNWNLMFFGRFTPGPEYQNVSTQMRKAKPSPVIKDCRSTHGLNETSFMHTIMWYGVVWYI